MLQIEYVIFGPNKKFKSTYTHVYMYVKTAGGNRQPEYGFNMLIEVMSEQTE